MTLQGNRASDVAAPDPAPRAATGFCPPASPQKSHKWPGTSIALVTYLASSWPLRQRQARTTASADLT
jgi:hypothetical protein